MDLYNFFSEIPYLPILFGTPFKFYTLIFPHNHFAVANQPVLSFELAVNLTKTHIVLGLLRKIHSLVKLF